MSQAFAASGRGWPGRFDRARLAYPALLILGAVDAAGYSVIAPVLPGLRTATGASVTEISLLAACFPLTMLAAFAAAGSLVQAGRTQATLLIGLVALLVGAVGFAVAIDVRVLFAARALMGIGSGCLWIGLTFRTLQYWPGQEYLCMSRIFAAYSVGALLGPVLGAIGGIHAPFTGYALLLAACVPLVMALPAPTGPTRFRRDRAVLRSAGFWVAAAAIMFAIVGTGTLDGVLPLHFADRWNQTQIGIAYAVAALLIAVSSAAAGHTRPGAALAVGGIGIVAGVSLAGVTDAVPAWLAALAMIGTGVGATQTGATGILLQSVPITQIVTAMVVWSQLGIVGYLAAPALGGQLVEHLGYAWIGVLPLVAALVVAVTALHARRSPSPR